MKIIDIIEDCKIYVEIPDKAIFLRYYNRVANKVGREIPYPTFSTETVGTTGDLKITSLANVKSISYNDCEVTRVSAVLFYRDKSIYRYSYTIVGNVLKFTEDLYSADVDILYGVRPTLSGGLSGSDPLLSETGLPDYYKQAMVHLLCADYFRGRDINESLWHEKEYIREKFVITSLNSPLSTRSNIRRI
jgi:hypothetical protein